MLPPPISGLRSGAKHVVTGANPTRPSRLAGMASKTTMMRRSAPVADLAGKISQPVQLYRRSKFRSPQSSIEITAPPATAPSYQGSGGSGSCGKGRTGLGGLRGSVGVGGLAISLLSFPLPPLLILHLMPHAILDLLLDLVTQLAVRIGLAWFSILSKSVETAHRSS
jgi:hypothetical protein